MKRDYRFDVARVLSMSFIVVVAHLYGYIYNVKSAYYIPECAVVTDACLGLFTFISGYLIGNKYIFNKLQWGVWQFYQKRLLRIIPLFLLSAIVLFLIGFNTGRATLNGILCISPFVKPRPMTLWYIPVILLCYLITPVVCRRGFSWRFFCALILFVVLMVAKKVIPTIDWRFHYNMFFYLVGLVSAPYFDWKFTKTTYVTWLVVALFLGLLVVSHYYALNVHVKRMFAGVGVFAILFICEGVANMLFNKEKSNALARLIINVSYASMACYMFHRLFFWVGELLWNPSIHWIKWVYMVCIVFPVMIFLSYYIQYGYDKILNRLSLKNKK